VGLFGTGLSLVTGAVSLLFIWLFIPLPAMQIQMMVLFTMLPPAVMNYMFAERFNIEPGSVASIVLVSNLLAVVTLPLILLLALQLG
jgi:predicted permease